MGWKIAGNYYLINFFHFLLVFALLAWKIFPSITTVRLNEFMTPSERKILSFVRMGLKQQLRFASSPLPEFPDRFEREFFLAGFYPWTLKYEEPVFKDFKKSVRVEFEVEVILKKQVRGLLNKHRYWLVVIALYDKNSTRTKFKEIKLNDED